MDAKEKFEIGSSLVMLIIDMIAKLQQITGMNDDEVMAKIKEESERSDRLIGKIEEI